MLGKAILIGLAILAVVAAQIVYESRATAKRRTNLHERMPFPFVDWEHLNSSISPDILKSIIETIASGLHVESRILRPEDTIEGSLARRGAFIIDDDTVNEVADQVEERLGVMWQEKWVTVQDAVDGIGKELERIQ